MSGVGISFGADRIYDVMNETGLFPPALVSSTKVLFLNFGPEEEKHSMRLVASLRKAGIPAEVYPDPVKLKKQMDYANRKNIPYVVMIGIDELSSGNVTVKDMQTGNQVTASMDELINLIGS